MAHGPFLNLKNMVKAAINYLRESKEELAKVSWPTQRDNNKYTILVITLSVGLGVFFFVLDWIFSKGLAGLINLAS